MVWLDMFECIGFYGNSLMCVGVSRWCKRWLELFGLGRYTGPHT